MANANVTLDVDTFQHTDSPFDATVVVRGAPSGATVTATLSQPRGRPPLMAALTRTEGAGGGTVSFSFPGLLLAGPTLAVLLAEVTDDSGTDYPSDAERVQVL